MKFNTLLNTFFGFISARSFFGNLVATGYGWYQANYLNDGTQAQDYNEFVVRFILGMVFPVSFNG